MKTKSMVYLLLVLVVATGNNVFGQTISDTTTLLGRELYSLSIWVKEVRLQQSIIMAKEYNLKAEETILKKYFRKATKKGSYDSLSISDWAEIETVSQSISKIHRQRSRINQWLLDALFWLEGEEFASLFEPVEKKKVRHFVKKARKIIRKNSCGCDLSTPLIPKKVE